MASRFAGKVAVVTGGSTGMGLATAKRFVEEGMDHVFITGRRKDALDAAVAEIGKNVTAVQGDVASLGDLDKLYDAVRKQNRRIDVLFANAGVSQPKPIADVDETFFDLHFDANVKGLYFTVQKALPLLNDGASVILNGSIATIKGFPRYQHLQRDQGRGTLFCPHSGERTRQSSHSRQHTQPGPYRHSITRTVAARGCSEKAEGGIREERSSRPDGIS